jgi:hypothetical protein
MWVGNSGQRDIESVSSLTHAAGVPQTPLDSFTNAYQSSGIS